MMQGDRHLSNAMTLQWCNQAVCLSSASSPWPGSQQWSQALHAAVGTGTAASVTMALQVGSLMWLRTTTNCQYRDGGTMLETMRRLYKQGGVRRFYRGFLPALVYAPLCRFGDFFANDAFTYFFRASQVPLALQTTMASVASILWRMLLTPVCTVKTFLQVEGASGMENLRKKVRVHGFRVLYHSAFSSPILHAASHWPWFFTFNVLERYLPGCSSGDRMLQVARSGIIGCISSSISDAVSNGIRVLRTVKQTGTERISYFEAADLVLRQEGLHGLWWRGYSTRVLANALQSGSFVILLRLFQTYTGPAFGREKKK